MFLCCFSVVDAIVIVLKFLVLLVCLFLGPLTFRENRLYLVVLVFFLIYY